MGEMINEPVSRGGKSDRTSRGGSSKPLPDGITWKESHQAQLITNNNIFTWEIIEKFNDSNKFTEIVKSFQPQVTVEED
jgi:hypothetical protein